jgi:hypothetical protein
MQLLLLLERRLLQERLQLPGLREQLLGPVAFV